jgi:hypothetical protein
VKETNTERRQGMEKGYIKLWRKFRDSPLWKEKRAFSRAEAFLDLLLSANGQDRTIEFDGKPLLIKRGQVLTSQRELAERWGWSKTKTRHFTLYRQNSDHSLKVESDQRKTLITIINYDIYNPLPKGEKTTGEGGKKTTEKPLKDHRLVPTNKYKRKKKENPRSTDYSTSKEIEGLIYDFTSLLGANDDKAPTPETDAEYMAWAQEFERLTSERSVGEIKKVMEYAMRDSSFWKVHIVTPQKLREKFPNLLIASKQGEGTMKQQKEKADIEEFLRRQKEARK